MFIVNVSENVISYSNLFILIDLGSRLWCLQWVCHFPIGILGQVWYLIVSIPDLCTFTYFEQMDLNWGHACDMHS